MKVPTGGVPMGVNDETSVWHTPCLGHNDG